MEREKLIATVDAARQGDQPALNELFNAYYNDVYYFALKTVKDSDLACDITQDTFVQIINDLPSLKESAAFVTWMKQIAYHKCTAYFRKKKDVTLEETEDGSSVFDIMAEDRTEFIPDEALDQKDFRKTILDMIDTLSEEQRSAVLLYYFDELPVSQIAQIQGVSEGTVKSRLNYGRKSIKKAVEDYEKKNNVRLHCAGLVPLILWLLSGAKDALMPLGAAQATAAGVTAATGTTITVAAGSAAATGATATVVAGSAAATAAVTAGGMAAVVGLGAKLAAIPLAIKTGVAALVATVIVAGGAVLLPKTPGIDFKHEIENFVPDSFNTRTLRVGERDKAQGYVWLSSGEGAIYTSDENVVTVATNGTVIAVGEGTAYVLVVGVGNMHEITRYEVSGSLPGGAPSTEPGEKLELPDVPGIDFQYEIDYFVPNCFNSRTLRIGEKDKARGEVWLSSGEGAIYTSNKKVVTVATNGAVTAVGEGTAYVLVVGVGNMREITRYEVSGSLPGGVQSTEPGEKLELPDVPGIDFQYEIDYFVPNCFNSRTLRIGEKDKARGEVWLSSGEGAIYTSNEKVVTVATNGAVTAVGEGTAYVLVVGVGNMREITRYEVSGSLPGGVQSTEPGEKLELPEVPGIDFQYEIDNFVPTDFNSRNLRVGRKDKAQAYIWLNGGDGAIYTSNEKVVTVATDGTVTAVGEGTAYVLVVGVGNMHEITRFVVTG